MSFGLGPKAPKACHSVAAAVRPWIKKRLEMKSRPAGPAFRCTVIRDPMPHLRRSTILCFACPRAHARGYLMTVLRTCPTRLFDRSGSSMRKPLKRLRPIMLGVSTSRKRGVTKNLSAATRLGHCPILLDRTVMARTLRLSSDCDFPASARSDC